MIYTAKLSIPVKQAFDKQARQSTAKLIASRLHLDPDTTQMDVVILGDRDFESPAMAQKLQDAIYNKHPDVCVIYLYQKDGDENKCDCEYKKRVKKMSPAEITEAFMEFVDAHTIRQGRQRVSSADFDVQENDLPEAASDVSNYESHDTGYVPEEDTSTRVPIPTFNQQTGVADEPAAEESGTKEDEISVEDVMSETKPDLDIPVPDMSEFTGSQSIPLQTHPVSAPPTEAELKGEFPGKLTSEEAYLAGIQSFEDWGIFKEHLTRESVVKHLINDSSEYVGLVNTIDVLNQRIEAVWRDQTLTPDQKFDKIRAIGLENSVVRAATNSQEVEKIINIISTIILSAKRTVDEKISSVDTALYKITTDKSKISDTTYIDEAIAERSKIQLELLNMSKSIVDIYKSIDGLVTSEIMELDKKLPSGNAFINEMMKPVGTEIFTPKNTSVLANKLMHALQENMITASQLEESINSLIDMLFNLCAKDEEIICYEADMMSLLKANRVEDVVITNTLLKKCMRLYVGADNTGRSATAITWSGVLSRRQNALCIDITGRAKFSDYGVESITLNEFMSNRIEKQFLCVASDRILGPDEVIELVDELKTRLNYYPIVNVIIAPEDENALTMLSEEALCVHYITNCTTSSISTMRDVIAMHKSQNIARKLICIDTPVSPLTIANAVGSDPTTTRVITLPAMPAIRACALRHDRPYEFDDIASAFEEAFR